MNFQYISHTSQSVQTRINNLKDQFHQEYKETPSHIASAPGRVNLIGEHIDYMGYGVFPFAIQQNCLIAFTINSTKTIRIAHVNKNYPKQEFQVDQDKYEFSNNYFRYILAGFNAVQYLTKQQLNGMNILVEGNVPLCSGLSSSSSLTVCAGLVGLQNLDKYLSIDKKSFVENIINYERLQGTCCGGMDQMASVFGELNKSLYITFQPLNAETNNLPIGYSFVIANSLTPSAKLESLGTQYNKRVFECRVCIQLIVNDLKINQQFKTFYDLQTYLNISLDSLLIIIENYDIDQKFTFEEIQQKIQNLNDLTSDIMSMDLVQTQNKYFVPYRRGLHVIQESKRVIQFRELCQSNLNGQQKAILMGKLMDQSQSSCKNLYDCSSDELDILIALKKKHGAIGSRLTGAGWGGCCVSMVKSDNVQDLIEKIWNEFYSTRIKDEKKEDLIFESSASIGAGIEQLKKD